MTAATLDPSGSVAAVPGRSAARPVRGLTFPGVLRSEWIKTWSLRSTVWSLGIAIVLMTGTTALVAWGGSTDPVAGELSAAELIGPGGYFAQLVLAVLGVLTITGEYSTGQIRSTVVAVPRRIPALAAKAIVLAVVAALTTLVGVVTATIAGMPFHDGLGVTLDLSDGETLRLLGGMPLYVAGIALLGFAIGALVRSSPGALGIVLGLLLVVEQVVAAIPLAFFDRLEPLLPSNAGSRLVMTQANVDALNAASVGVDLGPWQGFGVLLTWVAVLLVLAAVLLRRRDA
ncbi:ABC transporter permease subunit [Actinotalea fermentans]|uniref:ABC transporter permease n=1 Tax=Actinotalea fermentans TaxID=43671 RepID=A0A511YWT7_9CELL|nr:ABC transporter permease subunit [Actinotalea fermentans]KGM16602.1 hypothetical protein N867_18235 [Actinotalea fermentans ATCC 43279 = JCM 9966 = DSM 3133]GEN79674.1 ABC transporter permease [Actinotalea fermentans]